MLRAELTGIADEMQHNSGRSTASLRPPYSCHSNHDSVFFPATSAAAVADPALAVFWIGLCPSAVVPPNAVFPDKQHQISMKSLLAKCNTTLDKTKNTKY